MRGMDATASLACEKAGNAAERSVGKTDFTAITTVKTALIHAEREEIFEKVIGKRYVEIY